MPFGQVPNLFSDKWLTSPSAIPIKSLAAEAATENHTGQTSIAWLNERISQYSTMPSDTEVGNGKHRDSIIPPAPKQSFLDSAPKSHF
jgi:hypothetical protein